MNDAAAQRQFYAEEIQITSNIESATLVDALATVPRDRFLPPGPWIIRGEADFQAPPRQTPDADPRHVHHNIAVGIDPGRMLFNGAPGLVARMIDLLALRQGSRVLHVGTGLGYYTALIAHCVGERGRVLGIEVDADLAAAARRNLSAYGAVEVRQGNGAEPMDECFDAVLVNAGVTHPLPSWLDALVPAGRMILPITAAGMMPNIGKGLLILVTNTGKGARLPARTVGFVAIYSALQLRDENINARLGEVMAKSPFVAIRSLRRDAHEPESSCWLHTRGCCFSLAEAEA